MGGEESISLRRLTLTQPELPRQPSGPTAGWQKGRGGWRGDPRPLPPPPGPRPRRERPEASVGLSAWVCGLRFRLAQAVVPKRMRCPQVPGREMTEEGVTRTRGGIPRGGESSVTAASSGPGLNSGPRAPGKDSTGAKARGPRRQTNPAPPLLSCVTLGKLCNLPEPWYGPDTSHRLHGVVETIKRE